MALLLMIGSALSAQASAPEYLTAITGELERLGWTPERVEEFRDAGDDKEWDSLTEAEPDIVARALELARRGEVELQAAENVELAFELARMVQRMRELGFERRMIARVSFEGVRGLSRDLAQGRSQGEPQTGQSSQFRADFRERIRQHLDRANDSRQRASEKTRRMGTPQDILSGASAYHQGDEFQNDPD